MQAEELGQTGAPLKPSTVNNAATNLVNSGVFLAVAAGTSNADACNYSGRHGPRDGDAVRCREGQKVRAASRLDDGACPGSHSGKRA